MLSAGTQFVERRENNQRRWAAGEENDNKENAIELKLVIGASGEQFW